VTNYGLKYVSLAENTVESGGAAIPFSQRDIHALLKVKKLSG
tara:strand:- start:7259 stop:7384 length:126 start_codon:yes stop_codon:yes gene_type:complete